MLALLFHESLKMKRNVPVEVCRLECDKLSASSCSSAWAPWRLSHLPPRIGSPVVPSRKHLAAAELPFNALANFQHLSNREIKTSWEHPMPASHSSPGLCVQGKCLTQLSILLQSVKVGFTRVVFSQRSQKYFKGHFPFAFLQSYFQQEGSKA